MSKEKQTLVIIDPKYDREPWGDLAKHDYSLNDGCFSDVKQSLQESFLKWGITCCLLTAKFPGKLKFRQIIQVCVC